MTTIDFQFAMDPMLLRGLAHEDARERTDVVDHIEASSAAIGDPGEHVAIAAGYADCRDGDAGRAHFGEEVVQARTSLTLWPAYIPDA
jgi:hypothetical protein